jgi:ComF family protein
MPLPTEGSPCPYCEGGGVAHYDRIVRLGTFHDPLRVLIHHVKYHNRWSLAEFLADCLMEQERVKAILHEGGVLLPVPLHPLRQIARGFNQAEVMARRLCAKDKRLRIVNPVLRLRHTETQTHLHSASQRAENLRDAFGLIRPFSVRGQHVIVIDDVRTTGATMHALARALRPAKLASLSAIVVAVADPKGKDFEAI